MDENEENCFSQRNINSQRNMNSKETTVGIELLHTLHYLQGVPKMAPFITRLISSPNINRLSKFFYCQNQETICNETVAIVSTTP